MKLLSKTLSILCLSMPLLAMAGDIVKKPSAHSVKETMDKFEALVKSKGMDVFTRVNHQKNA